MKREYIKPSCETIELIQESTSLLAATGWTPETPTGETISDPGSFEFIHEGKGGDEGEAKFHHDWNVWDD